VPLLSLFELSSIDGYIQHHDDRDGFFLNFSVALRLDAKVRIPQSILLNLVAVDDEGPPKSLTVRTPANQQIGQSRTVLRFESKVTADSWFEFSTLDFYIGKIHFHLSMKDVRASSAPSNSGARGLVRLKKPVLLYPSSRSIEVKALVDPFISLGQPRRINLQLRSNGNEIRDCKISTKAATAGLRLRIHQTELINKEQEESKVKMVLDKDGDIRLSNIHTNTKADLAIPYTLESADTTLLIMNLQITYSTTAGTFIYYNSVSINTILPISINVQELFRATELVSRFTISPATLVPLRLTSCSINGGDQYDVEAGIDISEPWAVFPKQPASLVYRFTKRPTAQKLRNEPLPLLVDYTCIDETILSALSTHFSSAITPTPFAPLSRILTSHITLAYRTKWTEQDLEAALLLGEIAIWPFADINWEETTRGLSPHTQVELTPWLQYWHANTPPIPLDASTAPIRRISIPIEIPAPRVVITASLELSHTGPAITVGQPVLASLRISFTDHWHGDSHSSMEKVDAAEAEKENLVFAYELLAPPEQWLLGGRRKGNFTSAPHREHEFQILLLPQRAGWLMFPGVEVKCSANGREAGGEDVPLELDWRAVGRSVLVVEGLGSVTVGLDGEGAGGSFVTGSEPLRLGVL
jgi:hypothetical protein